MSKSAYTAPGLTVAEAENQVAAMTGLATTTGAQLTRIDQAITAAGQAATEWQGRDWWWAQKSKTFKTQTATISSTKRASNTVTITTAAAHGLQTSGWAIVSGVDSTWNGHFEIDTVPTASTLTYAQTADDGTDTGGGSIYGSAYQLKTVNSNAMEDIGNIGDLLIEDDYALIPAGGMREFQGYITLMNMSTSQPQKYHQWGDVIVGFEPPPGSEYDIRVNYTQRHSEITNAGSTDGALIVPPEEHYPVYVMGAAWLIRHDTGDGAALSGCPEFADAMGRLAARDPTLKQVTDARGVDPATHVYQTARNLEI